MTLTLYWLQGGGCGGDTFSLMNLPSPGPFALLEEIGIRLLWHPSLSHDSPGAHQALIERLRTGREPLDFLCVEGAVIRGPSGTGMYDVHNGEPRKNLIADLCRRARHVLAVGTCAAFGGVGADTEVEATGLQHLKWTHGGFLGPEFTSRSGRPVINLPGCPCHCDVIAGVISALAVGRALSFTLYNTPEEWYGMLVHQGCTRNEYHEYRVEEQDFGERGCLFFHKGCHGPLVYGPCNKLLWNRRNSKTRAGVPCFGCTRPGGTGVAC